MKSHDEEKSRLDSNRKLSNIAKQGWYAARRIPPNLNFEGFVFYILRSYVCNILLVHVSERNMFVPYMPKVQPTSKCSLGAHARYVVKVNWEGRDSKRNQKEGNGDGN
jgi:hypothetical protein